MKLTDWIAREEELLAKATPGPWYSVCKAGSEWTGVYECGVGFQENGHSVIDTICSDNMYTDALFIANVRTSHEIALKMLRRAVEALNEVSDRLDEPTCIYADEALSDLDKMCEEKP